MGSILVARRAGMALGRTGAFSSDNSGDFVLAFSTGLVVRHRDRRLLRRFEGVYADREIDPIFMAAIEATEEAIYDAMMMADTMDGRDGQVVHALPLDRLALVMARRR